MQSKIQAKMLKYQLLIEKELKKAEKYAAKIKELKNRRHRKLGAEMDNAGLAKFDESQLKSVTKLVELAVTYELHKMNEQALDETFKFIANRNYHKASV